MVHIHDFSFSEPLKKDRRSSYPFMLLSTYITSIGITILHECAHALAAIALYRNAEPKIKIDFWGREGKVWYRAQQPREWFGKAHASSLVAAAGPIMDIIVLLGITKFSRSNRKVARIITPSAISLSVYALSAFSSRRSSGHDFYHVLSSSGPLAYGLLTACCLATTTLVLYNAWVKEEKINPRPIHSERNWSRVR